MNIASPALDKSSYPLSEMGNHYFLEFYEVKEKILPYLENYEFLNNLLKDIFEKANLKIENLIKKIFEEEKTELCASSKVEKIKIIYILSRGHFNILTNKKNKTITIDFFLFFNNQHNQNNKHELHRISKILEVSLCDFFGWENCFLNLYLKRRGNSALKLPENKNSHAIILKNVKLISRKEFEGNDYRIYDSLLLEKLFIKNEQLLFSSKLFDLIVGFFYDIKSNKTESFNNSNYKFNHFTEYFPKLNFLLYNYQNLSNVLKSLEKKKETDILILGGDYMFGLLLMLLFFRKKSLKESRLSKNIKIIFEENDQNKVSLLNDNINKFGEFIEDIKNESLFEIVNCKNFSDDKVSNKYALIINLEEEKTLEDVIKECYQPLNQTLPLITYIRSSEREKSEGILKSYGFNKFDFTDLNEQDDICDDLIVIAHKQEE
jgi:hypothetical protein